MASQLQHTLIISLTLQRNHLTKLQYVSQQQYTFIIVYALQRMGFSTNTTQRKFTNSSFEKTLK